MFPQSKFRSTYHCQQQEITTKESRRFFLSTSTITTALTLSSSSPSFDDNVIEEQEIDLPTAQGVLDAYSLLNNKVVKTPLLESKLLNEQLGCRILIKAECLQVTGSFKYRGALNRLLTLRSKNPEAASKGVVAFSSGNFGQALAAAASSLNIKCCIVSPHDAPTIKLDRIKKYGANLVLSTASVGENREVIASSLAKEISESKGMTLLHPFEDTDVIHGQGTVGMEVLEQANDISCPIHTIVVPCGGGGLTAGINLAVSQQQQSQSQNINVICVEPKGYDDHSKSFKIGERKSLAELYPTTGASAKEREKSIDCDALMAGAPGIKTWEINSKFLSDAIESNGDQSAAEAMKVAFDYFRLVLEPSGALGLAAVLDGQIIIPMLPSSSKEDDDDDGGAIVVIASGGNTDLTTFARLMGCTNTDDGSE